MTVVTEGPWCYNEVGNSVCPVQIAHYRLHSTAMITHRKRKLRLKGSSATTKSIPDVVKRQMVLDQMAKDPTGMQGPQTVKLGVSTVPYTAMAVLHMVSIQPLAVPYLNHIHKFESPHRHGTVIVTAVYGSRRLYGYCSVFVLIIRDPMSPHNAMQQDVTRGGSCVIQQTWSCLLDSQTRRRVLTQNLQHIPTKTCSLRQNFVYERNLQPHERFYGE